MIIAVDASGNVLLNEADNFRGFKVISSLTDKAKLGDGFERPGAMTASTRGSPRPG
jgi:hypothetical protein